MLANSLLSELQRDILNRFFGSRLGQGFFLTGGTALAEYYLRHRYSEDLDLFTTNAGLSEFWLAGMLRQAETLTRLPVMLKPLELDALKPFYLKLADDLLRQIKPSD